MLKVMYFIKCLNVSSSVGKWVRNGKMRETAIMVRSSGEL
jgi:hypothetical protein